MNDITLISCSYNTPIVTSCMLQSWLSHHPECPILISENSTNEETARQLSDIKVPFIRNVGGLHGPSVNTLLSTIKTRYALLVDTDVLFLRNHDDIFEQFKTSGAVIMGEIVGDRGGKRLHKRVNPWHCFIDNQQLQENNIQFFDIKRQTTQGDIRYDIGSSMFEDVRKAGKSIANFLGSNYLYVHYEGMSWHTGRFGVSDGDIDTDCAATHTNYSLCNHGRQVYTQYLHDTEQLRQQTKLIYGS